MMGKKVLAAKSGRAVCPNAAAGGGIGAKNAKDAKSFLTGLTGLGENLDNPVNPVKTKPSGIPWIGDVPVGWEVRRLKDILARPLQYGASESGIAYDEALPRYIRITDITLDGRLKDKGVLSLTEESASDYILQDQDILLARSGATVGKAFLYEKQMGRAAFAGYLIRATVDVTNALPRFVYYTTLGCGYDDWRNSIAVSATIQNIGADKYNNYSLPMPPLTVQRAIAAYLDEKCGAIDTAVAEAKKGIDEYKAWKKSLIFEVVTGKRRVGFFNAESQRSREAESFSTGLTRFTGWGENLDNPVNLVKTKPSGIPWIGDVPVGWEVSRVKHHYELILGKMLCATSNNDANVRLPYVCAANVHFEGVALRDLKEMWFSTIEVKQYAIREGDLLVVEGGAGAGGAAICPRIDGIVGIQNSIILVRNKRCRDNRYLRYLLEALVKNGYVDFVCNKATIPHFTKDKLGNVPLPLPPLSEQQAIAAYLDEKCAAIDAMIAEKEALIADLEAYKKSLIFEVVTGKREVA